MIAPGKKLIRSLFVLILFLGIAAAQSWCDSITHRLNKEGFGIAKGYSKAWPVEVCYRIFQRVGLGCDNALAFPPSHYVNSSDVVIHGFSVENVSAKRPINTIGGGGASRTSFFECYRILNKLVSGRQEGLSSAQPLMLSITFGKLSRQNRFGVQEDWPPVPRPVTGDTQHLKRRVGVA